MKTGVIVGGTGAQGTSVIRQLSSLNLYHLKVLSRDLSSSQALALAKLPNVTLVQSSPFSHDEESFAEAAANADFAFINTDGFSIGEVAETYWGIRFWEISRRVGVKHFIYSSLDNLGPLTGYKQEFEIGHYAGKARVVDYLKSQNSDPSNGTFWSVITSGPYIEMLSELLRPKEAADGKTMLFTYPLGQGAIPFIHLDDFSRYAAEIVSKPGKYAGWELHVATVHATGADIANAFSKVTGKSAQYIDIPVDVWLNAAFGRQPGGVNLPVGRGAYPQVMGSEQERFFLPKSLGENFRAWWNVYKHSKEQPELVHRDWEILDAILPDRVKSVEEWMRKVNYDGKNRELLKALNDRVSLARTESNA